MQDCVFFAKKEHQEICIQFCAQCFLLFIDLLAHKIICSLPFVARSFIEKLKVKSLLIILSLHLGISTYIIAVPLKGKLLSKINIKLISIYLKMHWNHNNNIQKVQARDVFRRRKTQQLSLTCLRYIPSVISHPTYVSISQHVPWGGVTVR